MKRVFPEYIRKLVYISAEDVLAALGIEESELRTTYEGLEDMFNEEFSEEYGIRIQYINKDQFSVWDC